MPGRLNEEHLDPQVRAALGEIAPLIPRFAAVELFPFAWTEVIGESGASTWWTPPHDLMLRGIAAMSACGPDDTLRLEVNRRLLTTFSPLHLTHLWPECLCEQRVLGDLTAIDHRDQVRWIGPPNTIVVTYWLGKVPAGR